jgi:hypothetical protein
VTCNGICTDGKYYCSSALEDDLLCFETALIPFTRDVHETVSFGTISGLGNSCTTEVLSRSLGYSFGFDQFRCTRPG